METFTVIPNRGGTVRTVWGDTLEITQNGDLIIYDSVVDPSKEKRIFAVAKGNWETVYKDHV